MRDKGRIVLVFNNMQRFIGPYHSMFAAAKALGTAPASIRAACTGESISCKGLYFRVLEDDIQIGREDLGVLTLSEYDALCEVDRRIYPDRRMSRQGMKYKSKPKPKAKPRTRTNQTTRV